MEQSSYEKLTGPEVSQKLEGSSPYSQVPANFTYPDPTPSSPHKLIPIPEDPLNIILPSTSGSPHWSLSLRYVVHISGVKG